MSVFSDLRATLVADLAPLGVPVAAAWPDTLDPPCAFVAPPLADTYVLPGPNFTEFTVAIDLIILVGHDDADASLAALDELIQLALVNTADWTLLGVDAPSPATVAEGGAEYLATAIHLSKPVRL